MLKTKWNSMRKKNVRIYPRSSMRNSSPAYVINLSCSLLSQTDDLLSRIMDFYPVPEDDFLLQLEAATEKEDRVRLLAEEGVATAAAEEAEKEKERVRLLAAAEEEAEKERVLRLAAEEAEKERVLRLAAEEADKDRVRLVAEEEAEKERVRLLAAAEEEAEKERVLRLAAEEVERVRLAEVAAKEEEERVRLAEVAASEEVERRLRLALAAEEAEKDRVRLLAAAEEEAEKERVLRLAAEGEAEADRVRLAAAVVAERVKEQAEKERMRLAEEVAKESEATSTSFFQAAIAGIPNYKSKSASPITEINVWQPRLIDYMSNVGVCQIYNGSSKSWKLRDSHQSTNSPASSSSSSSISSSSSRSSNKTTGGNLTAQFNQVALGKGSDEVSLLSPGVSPSSSNETTTQKRHAAAFNEDESNTKKSKSDSTDVLGRLKPRHVKMVEKDNTRAWDILGNESNYKCLDDYAAAARTRASLGVHASKDIEFLSKNQVDELSSGLKVLKRNELWLTIHLRDKDLTDYNAEVECVHKENRDNYKAIYNLIVDAKYYVNIGSFDTLQTYLSSIGFDLFPEVEAMKYIEYHHYVVICAYLTSVQQARIKIWSNCLFDKVDHDER
jgi:hypothetical protein